jgi:hypothetical protein
MRIGTVTADWDGLGLGLGLGLELGLGLGLGLAGQALSGLTCEKRARTNSAKSSYRRRRRRRRAEDLAAEKGSKIRSGWLVLGRDFLRVED